MHGLTAVDLDFVDRAPLRRTLTHTLSAPVADVFVHLAARPDEWPVWFRPARRCWYEGEPPYGVDTVRWLRLRGGILARERVLVWQDGARFGYRVEQVNVPWVRALAEEWRLAAEAEGRTVVRWTFAIDCAPPLRPLAARSFGAVNRVFRAAMERLTTVAGGPGTAAG